MYHSDWFKLRYEVLCDYPKRFFDIGEVLEAYEFEGKTALDRDQSINPTTYPAHFKKVRWWEHRTIEQLLMIKYMKVISSGNYYGNGDVVEVLCVMYNNKSIVGGRDAILFNLNGHYFVASQVEPATKDEYETWKALNKTT